MIVDSMTHEEVYLELARDREYVTRWWRYKLDAQRRRVLKSTRFPLRMHFDYTSPRKIRYLFFTRIFERKMRKILTGIAVVHRGADGWTVYTNWLECQKYISPMVLTPHALKRYAERAKVKKTGVELVEHYFENNSHGKDSYNQRAVARSVRWNGEEHLSCCVNDGVLLGQKKDGIFVARTFITYEMCSGLQQREFESCREQIMTEQEMYDRARRLYEG